MKIKLKYLSDMLMPVAGRLLITAGLFATCPALLAQTYQNPILYISSDPDVSVFNGKFNMINPEGNHYLYRHSTDLVNWSATVNTFSVPSGNSLWEGYMTQNTNNGDIWLYYTEVDSSGNKQVEVAKSTNGPDGPWQTFNFNIQNAIDPYFFKDSDGSMYLYYKNDSTGDKSIYVQPLFFYNSKTGSPIKVLSPDCSAGSGDPGWECCGDYASVEGPCVVKYGSKYFLLYAGGAFGQSCYSIGFAYSTSPVGTFIRRASGNGDPIMSNWESPNCYSIGAPNVVQDGAGNSWVVYRQWPNPPSGSHHFCIDQLTTIDPSNNKINAVATHAVSNPAPTPLP